MQANNCNFSSPDAAVSPEYRAAGAGWVNKPGYKCRLTSCESAGSIWSSAAVPLGPMLTLPEQASRSSVSCVRCATKACCTAPQRSKDRAVVL